MTPSRQQHPTALVRPADSVNINSNFFHHSGSHHHHQQLYKNFHSNLHAPSISPNHPPYLQRRQPLTTDTLPPIARQFHRHFLPHSHQSHTQLQLQHHQQESQLHLPHPPLLVHAHNPLHQRPLLNQLQLQLKRHQQNDRLPHPEIRLGMASRPHPRAIPRHPRQRHRSPLRGEIR